MLKKLNSLKEPYKRFRFAVLASIVGNSIEFHIEDQKIELDQMKTKINQIEKELFQKEKQYSTVILKYLMVINQERGVSMYNKEFSETGFDPDFHFADTFF